MRSQEADGVGKGHRDGVHTGPLDDATRVNRSDKRIVASLLVADWQQELSLQLLAVQAAVDQHLYLRFSNLGHPGIERHQWRWWSR